MTVPARYVMVQPSLCAVYAQNWQIPNPSTSVTHRNYFHSGRSLNKDWTRGRIKHIPHQRRQKSACGAKSHRSYTSSPIRSASAFGFFEQNDEEINGKNCGKLLANKDSTFPFNTFIHL